jgi:hypothetical protein
MLTYAGDATKVRVISLEAGIRLVLVLDEGVCRGDRPPIGKTALLGAI